MSTFEVPAQSRSLTLKEVEQKTQHLYEKSVEENKEYWRQRLKKQRKEQFPAALTELEEVARKDSDRRTTEAARNFALLGIRKSLKVPETVPMIQENLSVQ